MKRYVTYTTSILKNRLLNKRVPILVTLCVTNRCNLNCTYCYEDYYNRNHAEFTTDQILQLIDELVSSGTKYISLNGGEALLREDIEQIIDRIKDRNILCHLSSNGLLVPQKINAIKKIDSLAISLDGNKAANDANRGKGSFEKIIAAFEALKKNNIKFHVHTVITKNNMQAVEQILALAGTYGFEAQFSPLRPEDSPNKNIGLDDAELKMISEKIIALKKGGKPVFFSHSSYQNLLQWPFSYQKMFATGCLPKGHRFIKCFIKNFACHIEANGLVYPCIVLVNKIKALNLLDVGFKKAWEHLSANECKACYNICCNDLNLIFGFNPLAISNACKIVIKRMRSPGKKKV